LVTRGGVRERLGLAGGALRSIGYGDRLSDKLAIAVRLMIVALFPLGILARRLGRPLLDPSRRLGAYRVRSAAGIFECPPGPSPAFLAADRTYEPALMSVLDHLQAGTVLDIGASLGFLTVRAARQLGDRGRVLAFEPHPVRFQYLKRNLELNSIHNVTAFECALGDRPGEAVLHDVDPRLGPRPIDATMTAVTGGATFHVPVRTVDDVLADQEGRNDIRLVKIDVEGYESQVLRGMSETMRQRPLIVFAALDDRALHAAVDCLPADYVVRELETHIYLAESHSPTERDSLSHSRPTPD
jgi:FkbM family methyltransferase